MPFQSFTDAVGVTKWKRGVRFSPKSLHEGDVGVVLGRAVGRGGAGFGRDGEFRGANVRCKARC